MYCLLPDIIGGNRYIQIFLLFDFDFIRPGDITPRVHCFHFCCRNNDEEYCRWMHPPLLYRGVLVLYGSWAYNRTDSIQCTRQYKWGWVSKASTRH